MMQKEPATSGILVTTTFTDMPLILLDFRIV